MNDYQAVKEAAAFNTAAQPLIDMGLAPVKVTAQRVGAAEFAGIGLAEVVVTSRRDWCGSPWFNVPDQPLGNDFSEACKQHDLDYNNAIAVPKAIADAKFLNNMLDSCSKNAPGEALCPTFSMYYYIGVVVGGWPSYIQGVFGK
jgi:hypothetical protein